MELNQSNPRNSILKASVIVLALLLLGSLAFIYKLNQDKTEVENNLGKTLTEKEKFQADLETKIAEYDVAIADNTALMGELEDEQAKMISLLDKLKKSEGDAASLAKYKNEFVKLKREMDNLVKENNSLKEKNTKLTSSLDSTGIVLKEARTINDTLASKNTKLSTTVEKGQKLSISNLNALAVKLRSSGKEINTDKASKADVLKISFTIAENEIAQSGNRTYYVQVIDSKNNVLGEKKNIEFGSTYLSYSFSKVVRYENKMMQVLENLEVKKIEEGLYFINVFDTNGKIVSKSSFKLK